ncbi:MAG: flagella basal body P-ring formation protein FlgA [Acidobacteriota bacterium]
MSLRAAAADCLTVNGDRIYLRDLATALPEAAISEPERMVGFAPRPGVRRTLQFREWAGNIRRPHPGEPDEICVQRIARTLTREELTAALEAAYSSEGGSLTIDVQEFPRGSIPVGNIVFPRSNLRLARPDPHSGLVQLIGYVESGSAASRPLRFPIWVRAHIESETVRVELTCPLASGDEITGPCVQEKIGRTYPFMEGVAVQSATGLSGRAARRSLAPGTILQDAMFYPRQDVKPRQEVSLVVHCGQANLRLKVISETGGAAGELVTVRLPDSNRRIRARVTAPGAAELLVPTGGTAENETKGT